MEWPSEFLNQPLIKWTLIILIGVILIVFITFFVQYNIDRSKGKHAKFLWFESNIPVQNPQVTSTNEIRNPERTASKIDVLSSQSNLPPTSIPTPTHKITKQRTEEQVSKPVTIHNSKNINTGQNYGNIGDTYTGIEQRHFTTKQAIELINDIKQYRIKYSDKIDSAHITIGYPGDKESKNVAMEAEKILLENGFSNIQVMILMTYGVTGKLYDVSNAPDNSVLVEIFPADNVQ